MCRALSCGRGLSGKRVGGLPAHGAAFSWGDKLTMNSFRQEDLPGAHEDLCASFRLQADILIVFPLSISTLPLMTATWKLLIPQSLFLGLNFRLISVVNRWVNGWWGRGGRGDHGSGVGGGQVMEQTQDHRPALATASRSLA